MKKYIAVALLALICVFGLVGCSNTPATDLGNTENSVLEKEITKAILEQYSGEKSDNLICVESHYTLSTTSSTPLSNEEPHLIIVYIQMLYETYSADSGSPKRMSSTFTPIAITFEVDQSGAYTVVEFWEAEPGANYETSIMKKFPQEAITKISALNSSEELEALNLNKVKEGEN